ncbi:MAG: HEPN domain-containing protein [Clostridiales bacterium]|nr:HEPN domain-containing protein [Clostridiales bacterium]
MDNRKKYEHWEYIAKYDLDTAKAMFKTGRYLYVVFMCQQAIEKIVKGLHVLYVGSEAPRTHNIWIVFKSVFLREEYKSLVLDEKFDDKIKKYKPIFMKLLAYYIAERYPSYKESAGSEVTKEVASDILQKSEEAFLWIQSLNQFSKF